MQLFDGWIKAIGARWLISQEQSPQINFNNHSSMREIDRGKQENTWHWGEQLKRIWEMWKAWKHFTERKSFIHFRSEGWGERDKCSLRLYSWSLCWTLWTFDITKKSLKMIFQATHSLISTINKCDRAGRHQMLFFFFLIYIHSLYSLYDLLNCYYFG